MKCGSATATKSTTVGERTNSESNALLGAAFGRTGRRFRNVSKGRFVPILPNECPVSLQVFQGRSLLSDSSKPAIKALEPVVVGADEVIFQGDDLAGLQKVVFNGIELKIRKQADGKSVWVKGLKAAGVTAEPKPQTLEFFFKSGKTAVTLNVSARKTA